MIVLCAVCFRAAANPATSDSLNAGILVLLGVTGVVLACFAMFFVRLAHRARRAGFADDTAGPPLNGGPVSTFFASTVFDK